MQQEDIEMPSVEQNNENEDIVVKSDDRNGGGERQIQLHPLVLFNIADHFTRQKCNIQLEHSHKNEGTTISTSSVLPQVIGALFGIQNGLEVFVHDSFEMKYEVKNGEIVLDKEFLNARIQQFAQVFPGFELLGWYSVGTKTRASDLFIHRAVMEFNESPLFLLLDPSKQDENSKKLPVSLFESELHILNGTPTMLFVNTPFKIETCETEGIAVDHVSKITPVGEPNKSSLHQYLGNIRDAVNMLNRQVDVMVNFLQASIDGIIPMDHELLRQASSITNQLPALTSNAFDASFMQEYNDTLLVTYLASLTKATHTANTVIERFSSIQERSHARGNLMP